MAIIRDAGEIEYHIRVQDIPDDEFRVVRFDGFEAISELFEIDVEVASDSRDVVFDDIVGKPVALTFRGKVVDGVQQPENYIHGVVSRMEQGQIRELFTLYNLKIVPKFWTLTNRFDTRIFQEMTAPQIVQDVFDRAGIPASSYRDALKDSYAVREYCVQYQESDWSFVARLMEEEGVCFFFEHNEDDHVLVLADDASAYSDIPVDKEIAFREATGQQTGEDVVTDFRFTQLVRKGSIMLRDYNFKRPQTNLDTNSQAEHHTELAHFEFPGRYEVAGDGTRLAKVRLEEQQASRRVARGVSAVRRFLSGRRFTLTGHKRDDLNIDWQLTRVEHHGYEPQALGAEAPTPASGQGDPKYKNEFLCIPAEVQFRPPRVTERPYIRGPQSAVVVGPSGEEIYTDPYGRVKVHFHWDRHAPADENSSCWIRVAQSWAGGGWGANFIPRIGQEVLVAFLDGDPDRPYLVGGLYNNDQMPPYELPGSKTMSTLKSASTPGAEGFNEIRFEDKAGEEEIYVHAQKTMQTKVLEDRIEQIDRDAHLIVKQDQLESIENERHAKVGADDVSEIGKDQHLKVAGKQAVEVTGSKSLKVTGAVTEEFGQNHSEKVTMKYFLKAMGVTIEAQTGITLKCGGNSVVIDPSGVTLKGTMVTVDGSMVRIASGPGSPPQPGQAGSLVPPASPREPFEVDDPDPGRAAEARAEQVETGQGRYGSAPVVAFRSDDDSADEEQSSWVEIELVDEEGEPVPGERYELTMPDGSVARGTLDGEGKARVENVEDGSVDVSFPELDEESWEESS